MAFKYHPPLRGASLSTANVFSAGWVACGHCAMKWLLWQKPLQRDTAELLSATRHKGWAAPGSRPKPLPEAASAAQSSHRSHFLVWLWAPTQVVGGNWHYHPPPSPPQPGAFAPPCTTTPNGLLMTENGCSTPKFLPGVQGAL